MNVSSELMATEFEIALQRWLHFISNNAKKKGFVESSWLGFIAVLYAYQETCKLLVWLITVAGSDFQQ